MGYTLQQLKEMGAKPVAPVSSTTPKKKYTLDELNSLGATPVAPPAAPEPVPAAPAPKPTLSGTLTGPLRDGFSGLKTLYGGGEGGIAHKLASDVQAGAADIEKGGFWNTLKGVAKAGLRTAGDVAGTVFAPVSAAIGATGAGKVFDGIQSNLEQGKGLVGQAIDKITDIPAVQRFATEHPNAGEDFNRAMNIAFSRNTPITGAGLKEAATSPLTPFKSVSPALPKALTKPVEQLRTEKAAQGYAEQNIRLKSAQKAFSENTKRYSDPRRGKRRLSPRSTPSASTTSRRKSVKARSSWETITRGPGLLAKSRSTWRSSIIRSTPKSAITVSRTRSKTFAKQP